MLWLCVKKKVWVGLLYDNEYNRLPMWNKFYGLLIWKPFKKDEILVDKIQVKEFRGRNS